jgi:hypothetical protein
VVVECLSKAGYWIIYFNAQNNSSGDVLWHYKEYDAGLFHHEGIHVFDFEKRTIAECVKYPGSIDWESKRKSFYGASQVFRVSLDGEYSIAFLYDDVTNLPTEVFCNYGSETDNDYIIEDFLQQQDIMDIFPWDQHTYYHSFEPMLP